MIFIFNLAIIGLVLLIAYWWANEGLFSSLLHLVCVITAGALALAVWEPITMAMMSGGNFDNYAWGIVLLGCFIIALVGLRFASDKLIPANLNFPSWANYAIGGLAGFGSGIITIGICLIASGFLQSSNEIMGYRGTGRDENGRAEITTVGDPIWLNVAKLTSSFYSTLSTGTLYPDISGSPLKHYNPKLDELSTLVRDSYDSGNGQLSLAPDAAKVTKVAASSDGMVIIQVSFNSDARDFGGQVILASSQVRLVGTPDGTDDPDIYYPVAWKQELKEGGEALFKFDDVSHYATGIPGRSEAGIKFAFDTRDASFKPNFIQIRGTRLELPSEEPSPLSSVEVELYRGRQLTDDEIHEARDPLGKDIQHLVDPTSKIRKLRISTNNIPGTIEFSEDLYFIEGTLTTQWSKGSSGKKIKGIQANSGTSIVQLNVSPGTAAAFEDLLPVISPDSPVVFIDENGRKYQPIGFILSDDKIMKLTLTPSTPIQSIGELPIHLLTSSKSKSMSLIFQITNDVRLTEFRVGEFTIGTCNVLIQRRSR
jgi:hypothetical protein